MTLSQVTRWQKWVGRLGALCCLLFVFASMDGLISHFRQPVNEFDLLPGSSTSVNGSLPGEIQNIGQLVSQSESDSIRITFEAIHAGFWMGGSMWRGTLEVQPGARAGRYTALVRIQDKPAEKALAAFAVNVHDSPESLRSSSKSLIRRHLDLAPWMVFALFFVLAGFAFGSVYLLTEQRDRLLAAEGKAELYRVAKNGEGYDVSFGLGKRDGILPGDHLTILAKDGSPLGTVRVTEVQEADATGVVNLETKVRPGYLVARVESGGGSTGGR